jgi:hypothetical protein
MVLQGLGKILVINDAPRIIHRVVQWLTRRGYHNAVAADAREAGAKLDEEEFDTVVFAHEFQYLFQAPPPRSSTSEVSVPCRSDNS